MRNAHRGFYHSDIKNNAQLTQSAYCRSLLSNSQVRFPMTLSGGIEDGINTVLDPIALILNIGE